MDMQTFWDEYYQKNDTPYEKPDEKMVEIVSQLNPGKVADLGAGDGNNSFWLAEQGWEVTAVDFAPSAIKTILRISKKKGYSFVTEIGDITDFNPKVKQELILIGFIHLDAPDRKRMLDHAVNALNPGGILLYLGITDIQEEPVHGIDPKIFAHADEVVADIEGLSILKKDEGPRMIDYSDGSGDTEVTGVVVVGRKEK